jgi:hypothetical protein
LADRIITLLFMKRHLAATALLTSLVNTPLQLAALGPGDIAFVGFNADGDDNLAFVAMAPIPGGTDIFLSDNEWNGQSPGAFLDDAESEIQWTAPAVGVPAGTVVLIDGIEATAPLSTSLGTVAYSRNANVGVGASGEAFFAFVGSSQSPTSFLTVIISGAAGFAGSLAGTGLVLGENSLAITTGSPDIMAYAGPCAGLTSFAAYLPYLHNPTNWITQDGTGNQEKDSLAPDVPFDTTPFTITATRPSLTITPPTTEGLVTLSWTPDSPGFVLQETSALNPSNWTNSPSGSLNPATISATNGAKFYRLTTP